MSVRSFIDTTVWTNHFFFFFFFFFFVFCFLFFRTMSQQPLLRLKADKVSIASTSSYYPVMWFTNSKPTYAVKLGFTSAIIFLFFLEKTYCRYSFETPKHLVMWTRYNRLNEMVPTNTYSNWPYSEKTERRWFWCGSLLPVLGVRVSVMFHLMFVHYTFSLVGAASAFVFAT